jgi:hypothetical protein
MCHCITTGVISGGRPAYLSATPEFTYEQSLTLLLYWSCFIYICIAVGDPIIMKGRDGIMKGRDGIPLTGVTLPFFVPVPSIFCVQ